MQKLFIKGFILLLIMILPLSAQHYLNAFPEADPGMVRYVLQLPQQKNEDNLKVELIAGKMVETDNVNSYFFTGKIDQETVHGWGFYMYKVSSLGPMAGSLMAVAAGTAKEKRFISLGGGPYLIAYNSQVPVVVYTPQDVEVRYRVWTAGVSKKIEQAADNN
jgi:ecotin